MAATMTTDLDGLDEQIATAQHELDAALNHIGEPPCWVGQWVNLDLSRHLAEMSVRALTIDDVAVHLETLK